MPNLPAPVAVALDRERHLFFTAYSLMRLEDETGKPFAESVQDVGANSIRALMRFLWAGLLHEDPALTVDDVARMIAPAQIPAIGEAVVRALNAHMPDPQKPAPEAAAGA